MERIDDAMLLDELKRRLEENRIALNNLRAMTNNLEAVNEKLRQSEELKTNFLSNIRNEINNPLTAIMGFARQVVDGKADAATARSLAQIIFTEAFDLDFQLRNIFLAAEIEAGELALGAAQVDVESLLTSQVAAFAHKAAEKNVSLSFTTDSCEGRRPLTFTTDPEKLQRIVANLLANAIEYNLEGKRVDVRAQCGAGLLTISIADEGIGIPEADRKKVFDRFVQLDTGARKRHKGHGLGLSITKALVDLLGGSISLARSGPGGCTFTVTIPELAGGTSDVVSGEGNEFLFEGGTQY